MRKIVFFIRSGFLSARLFASIALAQWKLTLFSCATIFLLSWMSAKAAAQGVVFVAAHCAEVSGLFDPRVAFLSIYGGLGIALAVFGFAVICQVVSFAGDIFEADPRVALLDARIEKLKFLPFFNR